MAITPNKMNFSFTFRYVKIIKVGPRRRWSCPSTLDPPLPLFPCLVSLAQVLCLLKLLWASLETTTITTWRWGQAVQRLMKERLVPGGGFKERTPAQAPRGYWTTQCRV